MTPWTLVQEMRAKICEHTGLTASAGIAPNCLLAKVCSDLNKPNGQYQLQPNSQDILQFVSTLSIRKVGGVGNVSEQLLKAVGVQTCQDLYTKRGEIRLLFSEGSSDFYLATSQGIGSTRIEPPEERERKSISTETTFRDTSDREDLMSCARILQRIARLNLLLVKLSQSRSKLILNVSRHCKQIDQCTLVQRSLPASWAVEGFPYVQKPPVSRFILVIFVHRSLLAGQLSALPSFKYTSRVEIL